MRHPCTEGAVADAAWIDMHPLVVAGEFVEPVEPRVLDGHRIVDAEIVVRVFLQSR
jgi:hypothetical protein